MSIRHCTQQVHGYWSRNGRIIWKSICLTTLTTAEILTAPHREYVLQSSPRKLSAHFLILPVRVWGFHTYTVLGIKHLAVYGSFPIDRSSSNLKYQFTVFIGTCIGLIRNLKVIPVTQTVTIIHLTNIKSKYAISTNTRFE